MSSALITTTVRPVEERALIVPAANLPAPTNRRPVETSKNEFRLAVTDVAAHDGALAEALHARLDFSKVVNQGCTVSAADAYAVLNPAEFARFEVVATAHKSVADNNGTFGKFLLCAGAAAAVGATSLALFSGLHAFTQVIIDIGAGMIGLVFVAGVADGVENDNKKALAAIPAKLAALPAPRTEVSAPNVAT